MISRLSGGVYFSDAGGIRSLWLGLAVTHITPVEPVGSFRGSRCTRVVSSLNPIGSVLLPGAWI